MAEHQTAILLRTSRTQRRNECVWTGTEIIIDDLATSWPHSVRFSAPEPKPVDDAGTRRRREVDNQGTLS